MNGTLGTLTELLRKPYEASQPVDIKLTEDEVTLAKHIFKEWLEAIALPPYYDTNGISITENIRKILVILVDEP